MPLFRLLAPFIIVTSVHAAEPTPADIEHFEKKVRPILIEHCYKCHSKEIKEPKASLRVDGRKFLLEGGDNGPAIVPGKPEKSKIIEAMHFKNTEMQMPPKGKLPEQAIKDLETWVKAGAPWPNDESTGTKEPVFDLAKRKAEHWAWKPVATNHKYNNVDDYIRESLKTQGLKASSPADKLTLLRRVTFAITGLPPTQAEIAEFEKDPSLAKVVDRLLASPTYGERWGRHWLDLVRYGETRGHEFDPDIPNARMYRDYVIRALNADLPYNQFVLEHIAGDVLPKPRIDKKTDTNESIMGPGFFHLGEEVHSPVDIRQDQAERLDNRIDVMSKTFMGLTVSCARCHDHKFDAISTKDYYALFGLLESSAYRQVMVDGWEKNREVALELQKLRKQYQGPLSRKPVVAKDTFNPAFKKWLTPEKLIVDYSNNDSLTTDGLSFGNEPRPEGFTRVVKDQVGYEPVASAAYDRFWGDLKQAPNVGRDHGSLGRMNRSGHSIRTPAFTLTSKRLHYLVRGSGLAYAAVGNHVIIAGPLHGSLLKTLDNQDDYRWVTHDLSNYQGQRLHVEFTADPKSDFAVAMVIQSDDAPPMNPLAKYKAQPVDDTLKIVIDELSAKEKELKQQLILESRLAPSLWDGNGVDSPVFIRGNHKTPGTVVPRRFLEALSGTDGIKAERGSGRYEIARQMVDPKLNPFISRVIVNRVWHHLFGRGIVASTDNFGVMGDTPSHPELLDFLADRFVKEGWSIKRLIRELILTEVYQQSSVGDAASDTKDPNNLYLHKFNLKRLEGEAIRDTMLAISGRLDRTMGGPSVAVNLTSFMEGRGRPGASGPLDSNGRRSIYIAVRRNFLNPFLMAFDFPTPFTTMGKRQNSNTPAQALTMMNDPLVHDQAKVWAKTILAKESGTSDRITGMYLAAFGRKPTSEEAKTCEAFVNGKEKDVVAWTELCHTLMNVKEFIYVK